MFRDIGLLAVTSPPAALGRLAFRFTTELILSVSLARGRRHEQSGILDLLFAAARLASSSVQPAETKRFKSMGMFPARKLLICRNLLGGRPRYHCFKTIASRGREVSTRVKTHGI